MLPRGSLAFGAVVARHLGGWIKLHRRILAEHSWVGHDGVAFAIFTWLVLMANSEDGYTHVMQGELIKRGQVVTSDRQLAKQFGFARTTVQTKLNRMAKDKMLGLGSGRWRGIITVLNYDKYQGEDDDVGPLVGPESGRDRAHNEEVVGFKESFSSLSPVSAMQGARARVDPPWRTSAGAQTEARRILAKALGAPQRAGTQDQEEIWEEVGGLGRAVITLRYRTFWGFWNTYMEAERRSGKTIVDGQFREEFAAILTDPEFKGAVFGRAIIGETENETQP